MSDCNVVSTLVTPLQGKSTVHLIIITFPWRQDPMRYNIQIKMCGMEEETGQTGSERMLMHTRYKILAVHRIIRHEKDKPA